MSIRHHRHHYEHRHHTGLEALLLAVTLVILLPEQWRKALGEAVLIAVLGCAILWGLGVRAWAHDDGLLAPDSAYYEIETLNAASKVCRDMHDDHLDACLRATMRLEQEALDKVMALAWVEAQDFPADRRLAYRLALFQGAWKCLKGNFAFRRCVSDTKQDLLFTVSPTPEEVIPPHQDAPQGHRT